jgi:hypothetical protein
MYTPFPLPFDIGQKDVARIYPYLEDSILDGLPSIPLQCLDKSRMVSETSLPSSSLKFVAIPADANYVTQQRRKSLVHVSVAPKVVEKDGDFQARNLSWIAGNTE